MVVNFAAKKLLFHKIMVMSLNYRDNVDCFFWMQRAQHVLDVG